MHYRSAFKSTHSLKFFWGVPLWWSTSHNRRMFSVEPDRPLDLSSGMIGSDRTFSCPRPPHTVWQHSVALAELPYYISRLIQNGTEIKQLKSCNTETLHKRGWSILLSSREDTQATLSVLKMVPAISSEKTAIQLTFRWCKYPRTGLLCSFNNYMSLK